MGLYDLHKFMFDVRHRPSLKEAFLANPETVYRHYPFTDKELVALRSKDIYRLHKFGVSSYLLALFAQLIGFPLRDFADILRAGAKAEQQQPST